LISWFKDQVIQWQQLGLRAIGTVSAWRERCDAIGQSCNTMYREREERNEPSEQLLPVAETVILKPEEGARFTNTAR